MVRHGETEWNRLTKLQGHADIELNRTGKIQAKQLGEYLSQYHWDAIVTSTLKRAVQTAEYIGEAIGLDVLSYEADLMERDYGLASGLTLIERTLKYPDRQYPEMETWEVLRDRVFQRVMALAEQHKTENLVIVSHGGAINAVLHTLSNGTCGSGITKLETCCINTFTYKNNQLTLESFNKRFDNNQVLFMEAL